jgi:RNA polymerase sigma factor (sigma-70 family)
MKKTKALSKASKTPETIDYKSLNEMELNAMVVKYEPLINKITKQYSDKVKASWEDLKSMAYEGFAMAIQNYDPTRSTMTFTQFAGFAIRNNILTSLNNELRTVKLSAYAQKKAVENGEAVFNSVSIEANWNSEDHTGGPKKNDMLNLRQEAKFDDGDIFETLYSKLEENLPLRDCEIFYRTFGLKDFEEEKGKDIAVYFGISRALVSIKLRSGIQFIQKDEELVEVLSNLLK